MNYIDWKSIGFREKYCEALQRSLHNFNTDHTHVTTLEEGQAFVNQLCDAAESAIKDACEVVNPATSNSTVTGGATRRTPWWTAPTKIAKSRKTFWYRIWICNGKPRSGHVYDSYKLAKCTYQRACREAFNTNVRQTYRTLNRLQKTKDSNQFWNVIKRSKQQGKCSDVSLPIDLKSLNNYFEQKFSPPTVQSEAITETGRRVREKISLLRGSKHDVTLNRAKVIKYIMQLKLNCALANDGITAEHLRHGIGSPLYGKPSGS